MILFLHNDSVREVVCNCDTIRPSGGLQGTVPMPKMKSHKASKKRFKVTGTGKLKRVQAGKKHLNSPKSGKRKRHLRSPVIETGRVAQKYINNISL